MSRLRTLVAERNPTTQPVAVTYSRWYGALVMSQTQIWRSYERALTDHDPFQSGAWTTWPAWYVQRQLNYMLGEEQ